MFGRFVFFIALVCGSPLWAQTGLTALARLDGDGVQVSERGDAVSINIEMTQAVPWRVFTLDDPRRLVVDFSELDWDGVDAGLGAHASVIDVVQTGTFRPGWSRMVISLTAPMAVVSAGMETTLDGAEVSIRLEMTDAATYAARMGAPESAIFDLAEIPATVNGILDGGRMVIVLDPGHGGIDPGAEREGVREADLMLTFARELEELLLRQDNVSVFLTRTDDVFVPLEERVSLARSAGADVFLSLHADALAEGRANGATVYTLAEEASDVASQRLAERHDRGDLLAGVDLSTTDDAVALVLMDLARTETQPRSEALADAVVKGIREATGSTYKTPRMSASFSVLKAPDIPSALIELGFLSSKRDRENLSDPEWRRAAAGGIRDAILSWAESDEALADRLRR